MRKVFFDIFFSAPPCTRGRAHTRMAKAGARDTWRDDPPAAELHGGAHVRKHLSNVRRLWSMSTPCEPLHCASELTEGVTVGEFAFDLVRTHHVRRKPVAVPPRRADA